jgi:hypothetical protein
MLGGYIVVLFLDPFISDLVPRAYDLTAVLLYGVIVLANLLSLYPSGVPSFLVRPRRALAVLMFRTALVIELFSPLSIEVIFNL